MNLITLHTTELMLNHSTKKMEGTVLEEANYLMNPSKELNLIIIFRQLYYYRVALKKVNVKTEVSVHFYIVIMILM